MPAPAATCYPPILKTTYDEPFVEHDLAAAVEHLNPTEHELDRFDVWLDMLSGVKPSRFARHGDYIERGFSARWHAQQSRLIVASLHNRRVEHDDPLASAATPLEMTAEVMLTARNEQTHLADMLWSPYGPPTRRNASNLRGHDRHVAHIHSVADKRTAKHLKRDLRQRYDAARAGIHQARAALLPPHAPALRSVVDLVNQVEKHHNQLTVDTTDEAAVRAVDAAQRAFHATLHAKSLRDVSLTPARADGQSVLDAAGRTKFSRSIADDGWGAFVKQTIDDDCDDIREQVVCWESAVAHSWLCLLADVTPGSRDDVLRSIALSLVGRHDEMFATQQRVRSTPPGKHTFNA